jgi:hypothetical protein
MLVSLYLAYLVTVYSMTFEKGRVVLGTVGMVASRLWLVDTFLAAKKRSRSKLAQEVASQRHVEQHAR